MFKKRVKTALSVVLTISMMLCLVLTALPAPAMAVSQSEIDSLQAQRDEIQGKQDEMEATISSLKSKQASVVELKQALDQKNELAQQQIVNLNEQIALQEELIDQKTVELDAAQIEADAQLEKLKGRVRAMEENGKYNYLEVLFGANSIGEFLSLMDDIGDIMQSDKDLEESYRSAVTELKTLKAEYEQAKDDMVEKKSELAAVSAQLEADIAEATATISTLQSDINTSTAALDDLDAQDAEFQAKISQMTKELAAQAENNSGSSGSGNKVYGTGNLVWPSYCTYIASRMGYRIHPITGQYKLHGGCDIGASYGTAIWAADSGTVVSSSDGWNGGWGNYVMIDHGNGMQTLYAHMSSRAVSVGQTVTAGQTIGYVGSTGMSTGPHLHFEMYVGGSRVDPQTYYSGVNFTY